MYAKRVLHNIIIVFNFSFLSLVLYEILWWSEIFIRGVAHPPGCPLAEKFLYPRRVFCASACLTLVSVYNIPTKLIVLRFHSFTWSRRRQQTAQRHLYGRDILVDLQMGFTVDSIVKRSTRSISGSKPVGVDPYRYKTLSVHTISVHNF